MSEQDREPAIATDGDRRIAPARVMLVAGTSSIGTNAIFDELEDRLRARRCEIIRCRNSILSEESAWFREAHILVASSGFACSRTLMEAMPRLRAVISAVTGTEGYDLSAATQLGICIANGQTAENYESMAEATVMLMLALLYRLRESEERLCRGQSRPAVPTARMLGGKTVGLIGFGKIARAVAERLEGWNAMIQVYAPLRAGARRFPPQVRSVPLDELLRTSDIISLHCALNSQTYRLLDRQHLEMIKRGAILINTARGELIDEEALLELAQKNRFFGLALDVFDKNSVLSDSPFRDLPNSILTPHMVGHTRELHASQVDAAYSNVTRALSGQLPLHLVNAEVSNCWLKRWADRPLI